MSQISRAWTHAYQWYSEKQHKIISQATVESNESDDIII
jgi:hypothetical protein